MSTANDLQTCSVIFVHGTGAGDVADIGQRWWQTSSAFSEKFKSALKDQVTIDPPFHWSGKNAEGERLRAAEELYKRLVFMESEGRSYHLVGHSHGGSVIWHALIKSAVIGKRLNLLRSWTTIGTPFFDFAPRIPSIGQWIAAVGTGFLVTVLFYQSRILEWLEPVRTLIADGRLAAFMGLFFLFFSITVLTAWAALRVAVPLGLRAVHTRRRASAMLAARWYGNNWLSIWHPLDEPINSLAGSLGTAPTIAPRLADRPLFRLLPPVAKALDAVLMRAADQFAWKQITDRAQGADSPNYILVAVGRAPLELAPGQGPLPDEIAKELTSLADLNSIGLVQQVRALLESAYEEKGATTVIRRAAKLITFREIIHNSYFENLGVNKIIFRFITDHSGPPAVDAFLSKDTVTGAIVKTTISSKQNNRAALEFFVASIVFLVPAFGLYISGYLAASRTIAPYTIDYQVSQIRSTLLQSRTLAVSNGATLAQAILKLHALDEIRIDPVVQLESYPHSNLARQSAETLALHFGRAGQHEKITQLLKVSAKQKFYKEFERRMLGLAYIGYSQRDTSLIPANNAFPDFASRYVAMLKTDQSPDGPHQWDILTELMLALMRTGETKKAAEIFETIKERSEARYRGYTQAVLCQFVDRQAAFKLEIEFPRVPKGLIESCPTERGRAVIISRLRRQALEFDGLKAAVAFDVTNNIPPLTPIEIHRIVKGSLETDNIQDVEQTLSSLTPSIAMLELMDSATIEEMKAGWANEVASRKVELIRQLAKTMAKAGARRISKMLFEVAIDEVGEPGRDNFGEFVMQIDLAVALGEVEKAEVYFLGLQAVAKDPQIDQIGALNAVMRSAWRLKKKETFLQAVDELLRSQQLVPTVDNLISHIWVANTLGKSDLIRSRRVLEFVQKRSELLPYHLYIENVDRLLAIAWSELGDYRRAQLVAKRLNSADESEVLNIILRNLPNSYTGVKYIRLGLTHNEDRSDKILRGLLRREHENPLNPY